MRIANPVVLDPPLRALLAQRARGRSLPARLVERARIILLAADGLQDRQIAAELRITPAKAARWRNRFLTGGITALEKDAPRPGRRPRIADAAIQEILRKTTQEHPQNAPRWSTRTMAGAVGVSEATVRRIWHAHGLKPHLLQQGNRSPR